MERLILYIFLENEKLRFLLMNFRITKNFK